MFHEGQNAGLPAQFGCDVTIAPDTIVIVRLVSTTLRENLVDVMVQVASNAILLEVVSAADAACRLSCHLHCWKQKCNQNTDDGDHHQQFNQRKTGRFLSPSAHFLVP